MSGGSVGPLLIPANYVGCLSANQMTGTFLLCPAHHTPEHGALHHSIGLVWPQHCIVGHRNIAMQGQSSENLERRFRIFGSCLREIAGVASTWRSLNQETNQSFFFTNPSPF